jgi:WD40 repeat protein
MQLIKTYSHCYANTAIFKVSFIDKHWLVSGGQDGFAHLYDVQSGQLTQKLEHDAGMCFVDSDTIFVPDTFTPTGVLIQTVAIGDFSMPSSKILTLLLSEPYPA